MIFTIPAGMGQTLVVWHRLNLKKYPAQGEVPGSLIVIISVGACLLFTKWAHIRDVSPSGFPLTGLRSFYVFSEYV
ncbi:hypothetical protein GCM10023116_37340 [Kistimonas scapharcae]|uniref:Uncharacterized protein n=1 Tax=Kistimonas scapharcae TaxID=1036133 RepID=A0ABP8V5X8_9GAMM